MRERASRRTLFSISHGTSVKVCWNFQKVFFQGSLTFGPMRYCVTDERPLDNMLMLWLVHIAKMQLLTDNALPFENESSDVLLSLRLSELKRNKQHGMRKTVTPPPWIPWFFFFISSESWHCKLTHGRTPTSGTGGPLSLLVVPCPCERNTTSGTHPVDKHDNLQSICMYQQLTTNESFCVNGNAHVC